LMAVISGTGKATNFKRYQGQILCPHSSEQKRIKHYGKSSRGHSEALPKIFTASIFRAHRAVIFAIAQLSCCLS